MGTVANFLEALDNLNPKDEAVKELEASREEMVDEQRTQLKFGKRKDGKRIGKYKNPKYAAKKFAQNPLAGFGNMDWILTGDLSRALFVDVRSDAVIFDSADSKTGGLIDRFGDPFGLSQPSIRVIIERGLRVRYIARIKLKLGL